MKASVLRQLSNRLLRLLGVVMLIMLMAVGISQYVILSGMGELELTLLGRVEGEPLDEESQIFLVGKLPTEVYDLQLRRGAETGASSGIIRILLDHHLIEAMDQTPKTIVVQRGQLLELDCSALTADTTLLMTLDRRLGADEITVNLLCGKINHVDWEKWAFCEK